jgi:hypothetical protein
MVSVPRNRGGKDKIAPFLFNCGPVKFDLIEGNQKNEIQDTPPTDDTDVLVEASEPHRTVGDGLFGGYQRPQVEWFFCPLCWVTGKPPLIT